MGNLYSIVMDGGWTIDRLNEIVKGVYQDIDGDGQMTDKDLYRLYVRLLERGDHIPVCVR